ncbi:MAG: hypothetical protein QXM96_02870, partial [Candidatus Woesearchaeota archaeon]
KKLQEELKARREEFLAKAKQIQAQMTGKENKAIKNAMIEAGIPNEIIKELIPDEKPAQGAGAKKK